ncbi:MAG: hypothetical protein E7056_05080 [Lentisphaerae bacterium]|nr:hypothetical protein [Lentisphaerota bacterium]
MIKQIKDVEKSCFSPEDAINSLLAAQQSVITIQDILKLAPESADSEAAKLLTARIVRELDFHEDLIPVIPGEKYLAAETLFNGREFLIVPDGFEIENNILIPGHRFVPFMSQELFPSEITLKEAGARKRQSSVSFSGQAENIIKYHLLMGAETLFDFFAAEAEENMEKARNSANPELKLAVLDMQKFYAETDFSEGDALLVKVVDYRKGEFEFHLDSGKQRSEKNRRNYRQAAEDALTAVVDELLPGVPIVESIRCMFANHPELLKAPAMSLDEILMSDSIFDIAFDEDGSTLVRRSSEEDSCSCGDDSCSCGEHHHHHHHHEQELPDNVTIGSGEIGSLESMLAKLYPMLNMLELDAILLDNLKNHDFDFNSFYSRSFGETKLDFADGMQEACFFNELESRFEEMLDTYPREYDNQTAEIRSMIVEFTMERCTLLSELAELSTELEIKPELFEALAEVALLLDETLKLVNSPASLGEDFDFEQLREGVENALESGEEALSALRGVLDSDD